MRSMVGSRVIFSHHLDMSSLSYFFHPWGIILVGAAIVHFIRRRPDTYWLWIILFGGGLGALVYIAAEVLPDMGLLRQSFRAFPRRRRIHELEAAILDNPSAGNYEELADLYLEERKFTRARQCYDKAISSRTDSPDPLYRRAIAEIELQDFSAAIPDLERVVAKDPKYDFHRATGLLAHADAKTGQAERAEARFQRLTNDRVVADFLCVFILKHENSWFAGLGFLRTPRNCRRWHRRSGVPGLLFLPQALNFIA